MMKVTATCIEATILRVLNDKECPYIDNQESAFDLLDAVLRADSVGLIALPDEVLEQFVEYVYSWTYPISIPPQLSEFRKINALGYVYLLQSPTGAYKIGRSKNPKNRIATFSVKLPFEVEYIALIETHDMAGLERDLHDLFAHKRINGEWFNLETEDVEYIKELANDF